MDNSLFTDLALPSLVWQAVFRHLGWTLALAVVLARLSPKRWAQRWWWGLGLGVASNLPILTEVTSALALSFQTPSLLSQGLLACALWRGLRPSAADSAACCSCRRASSDQMLHQSSHRSMRETRRWRSFGSTPVAT